MTTAPAIQPVEPIALSAPEFLPRPKWLPVLPALCMIPAAISWMAGGSQFLNDVSWIVMTLVCAFCLMLELKAFPYRMGVGGVVLFTGVLGWFCWDYLAVWCLGGEEAVGLRFTGDVRVLAKATFAHMLFITMATIGLLIRRGEWLPRLIAKTPQPANPRVLLTIIVGLFLFSLLPYVFFTNVPWYQAIWDELSVFRQAGRETATIWTVGRTGRLNVAWGGYVAFWLELGTFAAVLAAFYALFMTRHWPAKALCWAIWMFAMARSLTSGSRGEIVQVAAPLLAMLFIRYQSQVLEHVQWLQRNRFKAYTVCLGLLLTFYGLMQFQAYNRYRGSGIAVTEASLDFEQYVNPQGNMKFSESLLIFELVPETRPFFYNRFPGEAWVRPIPQTVFEFIISPIPRALWQNKPVDQAIDWYNIERGGAVHVGKTGATVSQGLVGWFWLRYGIAGVIEGGLLFGWLLLVIDRAILLSRHKPLILIIALGLAAFMFRSFRDLRWFQLNDLIVGIAALWMLSLFTRRLKLDAPASQYT
ncbi:MAG: hypothetical protein ACYSTY_08485 [Planctomycetota bacterium]|jgi:hypothetical protein